MSWRSPPALSQTRHLPHRRAKTRSAKLLMLRTHTVEYRTSPTAQTAAVYPTGHRQRLFYPALDREEGAPAL